MKKLERAIQITVLEAIVEADFDLEDAAKDLGTSRASMYRMLSRWRLPTPVGGNPGRVKFSEYTERCNRIKAQLDSLTTMTN